MTFTTLGTNAANVANGTNIQLTVPAGGIPAGSFIYISVCINNIGADGTFSAADDAGNTYTEAGFQSVGTPNSRTSSWYAYNASALTAGQHVWIHNTSAGTHNFRIMGFFSDNDFYSAGNPYDAPASSATFGTGTTLTIGPSFTPPANANSWFIGSVYWDNTSAFTQSPGWSTPPDQVMAFGTASMAGGRRQTSTAAAYSPTVGTAANWVGNLLVFRPAVVASVYTPIRRRGPRFVDRIIRI